MRRTHVLNLIIFAIFPHFNTPFPLFRAEIVRGVLSNVVSSLVKKLWSMKSSAKTGNGSSLAALHSSIFAQGNEVVLCIIS